MAKHRIGTKLTRLWHIPLTIYEINEAATHYRCFQTNDPSFKLTLPIDFLDDPAWKVVTPMWLYQKDSVMM